jgi:hypothetical protein
VGCRFGLFADGAPAGAKQTSASHDVLNSFMQTHSSFTILEEQQRGLSVNAGTSTNNHGGGAAVAAMEADDGKAVVEVASANKGHARKSSGGGKKDRASKKKGAKGPKPQAAQAEAEARAVADVETRAAPTTPERSVTSGGGGGGAARQTVAATSSAPATPVQGGMRVTEEVATGTPAGGAGGKRVSRMERMQVRSGLPGFCLVPLSVSPQLLLGARLCIGNCRQRSWWLSAAGSAGGVLWICRG